MKKILLCILAVSFTTSAIAQTKEGGEKSEFPIYLQDPTNEERKQFLKKLKADNLSDDEFEIIGHTEANGEKYISVFSNLKFTMAIVAAAKNILNDGKQLDRQVLLYHDRTKIPISKQLKLEENRVNDGLMGVVRQTSQGKLFIKMYYPGVGFVDANK